MDRRVALEREELRHPHAAGRAHAGEVVPHQVHDHQVLGAVLCAFRQRLAERAVVLGTRPARARALDRPRLDVAVHVDTQEALGRRAHNRGVRALEVRGKRRRVPHAHAAIEVPRGFIERRLEPLRQVRLEDVPGVDVFHHAPHRVQVVCMRERRPQLEPRVPVGGDHVRRRAGHPPSLFELRGPSGNGATRGDAPGMSVARAAARFAFAAADVSGMPVEMIHARDVSWSHATTQSYTPRTTSGSARSS